jgi:hypothetical protein
MNSSVGATNGVLIIAIHYLRPSNFRRILLFPFGNSNAPPNDTVSVYLDYAEPKKAPEGWHACAQFALVISNIHDPTVSTVSRALHPRTSTTFSLMTAPNSRRPTSVHCGRI